jgi:hypothetical protein
MSGSLLTSRRGATMELLSVLLLVAGCGQSSVVPSDQVARTALETALNAWRDGGHPGTIAGTDPSIQAVDTAWSQGEKLAGYEIVREERAASEKRFTVQLQMKEPAGSKEAQYDVIGRSPVWVYRHEDYVRNMNMENNPKETPNTPQRLVRRR